MFQSLYGWTLILDEMIDQLAVKFDQTSQRTECGLECNHKQPQAQQGKAHACSIEQRALFSE